MRAFIRVEDAVYVGLGTLLAAMALALLVAVAIAFAQAVLTETLPSHAVALLDRLLLILMIVEILYTVQVSFSEHALVPEPFLIVGLIATIRRLLVLTAEFARSGDPRSAAVENVGGDDDVIRLTWWDCIEPFVLNAPPGFNDRPIGVFSTFFPAKTARVELNGKTPKGQVWAEMRGDRQSSSACLAWSETWVKPRG